MDKVDYNMAGLVDMYFASMSKRKTHLSMMYGDDLKQPGGIKAAWFVSFWQVSRGMSDELNGWVGPGGFKMRCL